MKLPIDIYTKYPIHISCDPSAFGHIFAHSAADDQVAILRAMVEQMRPHKMQWDYIAIELEKPENAELLSALKQMVGQ